MLRTRVITAVILLVLLLGALMLGPLAFTTFAAVAFGAATFEWLRFAAWRTNAAIAGGVLATIVLAALQWLGIELPPERLVAIAGVAFALWVLVACWIVYAEKNGRLSLNNTVVAALAPLLLG